MIDVGTTWAAVWHDAGAFDAEPLAEFLKEAGQACVEDRRLGKRLVGVFSTMEEALAYNRTLKRMRRGRREQGAEGMANG